MKSEAERTILVSAEEWEKICAIFPEFIVDDMLLREQASMVADQHIVTKVDYIPIEERFPVDDNAVWGLIDGKGKPIEVIWREACIGTTEDHDARTRKHLPPVVGPYRWFYVSDPIDGESNVPCEGTITHWTQIPDIKMKGMIKRSSQVCIKNGAWVRFPHVYGIQDYDNIRCTDKKWPFVDSAVNAIFTVIGCGDGWYLISAVSGKGQLIVSEANLETVVVHAQKETGLTTGKRL